MSAAQAKEIIGHVSYSALSSVPTLYLLNAGRPCFSKNAWPKGHNRGLGQPLFLTGCATSASCLPSFTSPSSSALNSPRHPTSKWLEDQVQLHWPRCFATVSMLLKWDTTARAVEVSMEIVEGGEVGSFNGEISSVLSTSQANNEAIFQHLQA